MKQLLEDAEQELSAAEGDRPQLDPERRREFNRSVLSDVVVGPGWARFMFRVSNPMRVKLGGLGEGSREFTMLAVTEWTTVGDIKVPRRIGTTLYMVPDGPMAEPPGITGDQPRTPSG